MPALLQQLALLKQPSQLAALGHLLLEGDPVVRTYEQEGVPLPVEVEDLAEGPDDVEHILQRKGKAVLQSQEAGHAEASGTLCRDHRHQLPCVPTCPRVPDAVLHFLLPPGQVSRPGQLLQARSHVRHHRAVGLELADVLARLGLLEVAHPECPEPPLVPREGVQLVVVAQNDDAQHGSSVSVIIDHAFQVFVDSRDISILGVVRDVEDDGDVLPTLLVDLADDALNVAFAEVL